MNTGYIHFLLDLLDLFLCIVSCNFYFKSGFSTSSITGELGKDVKPAKARKASLDILDCLFKISLGTRRSTICLENKTSSL